MRVAKVATDRLKALPEGTLLTHVFYAMAALTVVVLLLDLRTLMANGANASAGLPALSPVRMERPERDNQIRPYLPATRPMAPDETSERLQSRPREESEAAPMHFRLGTHGAAFAEGTITPGTADAFAEFLAAARSADVKEIVLHSPGGSVNDAEEMAHTIRDLGLDTRVLADGYCASSCPLVFAGGVQALRRQDVVDRRAPGLRADDRVRLARRRHGAGPGRKRHGAGHAFRLRRRSAGLDARNVDAEGEALPLHAGGDDRAEVGRRRWKGKRCSLSCRHCRA